MRQPDSVIGVRGPGAHDDPFVTLYGSHRPRMVRLATLLVDRVDIAEELVQEAFATTYRRWATLDDPPAYLRAAVVNACRSELRRRHVRRTRPIATPDGAAPPDDLRDTVAALPERQRTVVVLRFYEDLPLRDIAELMGIHVGTAKSQLHRALARLRKEIHP